jgi:hypothetical protein
MTPAEAEIELAARLRVPLTPETAFRCLVPN